ncbi:conjugal transfer protein TraY (plasmid) [Salmonella enterica subsp. enterica serovar Karamoja]|uniref:Conjugal transfer protein TraY n=1 Tax=Salmonella enterica subsp. enterica serovar Karamoja TaxID=2500153 RepID=A0A3Q9MNA5_SALET|nr:DotA/TraY family protein [Salmonella enterica]AZT39743.1 conjugal transfer protein TraY [Salmonella enterica subsp. enterica serovar Karamoja]AZT44354.1 conjugal transfer protein TraY [Salmonella enterica subsp. enterica serovar Karamoja]
MKKISLWLSALLMAVLSCPAFAGDISMETIHAAAVAHSEDLSRRVLVMIFGNVVNNPLDPGDASMLGNLYFVLNSVIAATALFWFLVITFKQIVRTGHAGKVFGAGGFTMLSPISTCFGFMSIVPLGSGWSLMQLLYLWAISIFSVGTANLMTDVVTAQILSGKSLVIQPVANDTVSAARAIFEMNLCRYGVNDELNDMYTASGKADTPMMEDKDITGGFAVTNGSAVCGSARLPTVQEVDETKLTFGIKIDTSALQTAQANALTKMEDNLVKRAAEYVEAYRQKQAGNGGTLPDAETIIQNAAQDYETTVNAAVTQENNSQTLQTAITGQLTTYGWLSLGAWYQTLATANTKTDAIVKMIPSVTGPSRMGDLGAGELFNQVYIAYKSQTQNSPYTPPLGTQTDKGNSSVADTSSPDQVVTTIMSPMLKRINSIATSQFGTGDASDNDQMNPLLKMKTIGDYTLDGAEAAFTIYTAARALVSMGDGQSLVARVVNSITGAGDAAKGVLDAISPMVYCILFILFGIGFSLSIYLPFIPFIYWMTAFAGWIVSVVVAPTAGPLWAWTHIGTEADKGSKSLYGYIYLIDVMIRPSLMVLGFFFAGVVIVAVGSVLDQLFAPAIANVQASSFTGVVSLIGILMIYSRICTMSVASAFSLPVVLPDYVIAWLGGREGVKMLNGAIDSTRNMFASFGSGAGRVPNAKLIVPNESGKDEDGIK